MFKSLTKLFNQPEQKNTSQQLEDEIMLFVGLLVEAASIDGKIDESEILIIKNFIIDFIIKFSLPVSLPNLSKDNKKILDNISEHNKEYKTKFKTYSEMKDHKQKISGKEWEKKE